MKLAFIILLSMSIKKKLLHLQKASTALTVTQWLLTCHTCKPLGTSTQLGFMAGLIPATEDMISIQTKNLHFYFLQGLINVTPP